jgi:asparagine synthase (glutamine-hydrolysing)
MCGIAGIISLEGSPASIRDVQTMTGVMQHRGPDDEGTWSGGPVALGATRLKIVDLTQAGHQPMLSADRRVAVVYNGEVYNHVSLRDQLIGDGVSFRSRADTEVVLEAWRTWGQRSLAKFDGMFALAIWDEAARSLLLARDPLGIKPLYYTSDGSTLAFASEVGALVALNNSLREVRQEAIEEYLTFRDVAGELTLFRHVRRLLPGHCLRVTGSRVETSRYADDSSWPEASGDLATVVERSVASQIAADVPVGTLCSGGIDSGLVTYFAARASRKKVKAFTVIFPGSPLDEALSAKETAEASGAEHEVLEANPETFADDLTKLARHNDEPMKYENTVLLYQVCALARRSGVIVLLAGEGADELFGGYPQFIAMSRLSRYRFWKGAIAKGFRPSLLPLPVRVRRKMYELLTDSDNLFLYSSAFTSSDDVEKLIGRHVSGDFPFRRSVVAETRELDLAERMRRYDLKTYLPAILMRQDKASMAASVEARVPMLGRAVVARALAMPARTLAGRSGKLPLRAIAAARIPSAVNDRRKIGFSTPISEWIRRSSRLRDIVSALTESDARIASFVDQAHAKRAVDDHLRGAADRGPLLWTLLALELWLRECCSAASAPPGVTAASS